MNAHKQESTATFAKNANGGRLASEISSAHQSLNLYGRSKPLSRSEMATLKRLIELHAFREEWDRIIDLASRSIVVGLGWADEIAMYRTWVEGLKEDLDTEGLTELGRHLLARRREHSEYLALATLAFSYAGKPNAVKTGIGQLYRMETASEVVDEVLAIVKCEAINREERMMGLRDLAATLKNSECGYLAYRRFLNYAFENNALSTAAATLKSLNKKFPQSPDAYMVSALLDVNDGEWATAMDALRVVISNNPAQTEAILMMARCLEMTGKFNEARYFLLQNAHHFVQGDYEFHIQLGMLEKRMSTAGKNAQMMRDSAAGHMKIAMEAAKVYGFPTAPIQSALVDLGVVRASAEAPRQRYWLLAVEPKPLASLLDRDDFQLRCPREVQMGDVIFFAAEGRAVRGVHSVSGFFKARSVPSADPELGVTVRTGNAVVFERDVAVTSESGVFVARDSHGLENFSTKHSARFFELDASVADSIVNEVEGMRVRMARAV